MYNTTRYNVDGSSFSKGRKVEGKSLGSVVSVALALLMGTRAGKEKHEMNIQKLLVCSEM